MLKGRIHFAHIRNLRFNDGMRDFEESAHLSEDGTFDMHGVMKALYETGFDGPIRPDHGRMIWARRPCPATACMTAPWVQPTCAAFGSPSARTPGIFNEDVSGYEADVRRVKRSGRLAGGGDRAAQL